MTERDAAYKEGQQAWKDGKGRQHNPYSFRSEEADFYNWIAGFNFEADKQL